MGALASETGCVALSYSSIELYMVSSVLKVRKKQIILLILMAYVCMCYLIRNLKLTQTRTLCPMPCHALLVKMQT